MRVTTIFNHILDLPKTTVSNVEISADYLTVIVKLRGKKLHCPKCDFVTKARYDTRPVRSYWRHLDIGKRRLELKSDLRRLKCPTHGVIT